MLPLPPAERGWGYPLHLMQPGEQVFVSGPHMLMFHAAQTVQLYRRQLRAMGFSDRYFYQRPTCVEGICGLLITRTHYDPASPDGVSLCCGQEVECRCHD